MKPKPACLLCSADGALARRLTGLLRPLAPLLTVADARELDVCLRLHGPSVLLLDLRQRDSLTILSAALNQPSSSLAIVLGVPGSEPMLEAEIAGAYAVEDLAADGRRISAVVTRAMEHLALLEENRALRRERTAAAGRAEEAAPATADRTSLAVPLHHLSKAFRHFDDVATLLDRLAEALAGAAMVVRVGIVAPLRNSDVYRLRAGLRCLEGTERMEFAASDPFVRWLEVHAHLVARTHLEHIADPSERSLLHRALDAMGAELIVPLQGKRGLLGWLFVGHRSIGLPFDQSDLETFSVMAEHVSILLEKALLHEEIAVQKTLAETLLHSVPTGIVAADADGTVRWFNESAQRILSIDASTIVGHSVEAVGSQLADLLRQSLAGQAAGPRREWLDPATRRILAAETDRLVDEGRCLGAVAFIHDLTRERFLKEKQDELERASFWTDLAAAMSHEVRNPLVAISTFAQLLPDQYGDPEFRDKFREVVTQEVQRLNTIIGQINAFAHPHPLAFTRIDVAQTLTRARHQAFTRCHPAPGLAFELDVPQGLAHAHADDRALADGIAHLIVNAVEAVTGREGGRIIVGARPAGADGSAGLRITVRDNGPGIPERLRDKVFSPFATTKARGMGLGLAIARRTVVDHGGCIEIDTGPTGTSVTVTLPPQGRKEEHETYPDRG